MEVEIVKHEERCNTMQVLYVCVGGTLSMNLVVGWPWLRGVGNDNIWGCEV
jgi:hypothetical protein